MAKIIEETITIKLSKIVKTGAAEEASVVNDELLLTLESVAQELLGDSIVVEVSGDTK